MRHASIVSLVLVGIACAKSSATKVPENQSEATATTDSAALTLPCPECPTCPPAEKPRTLLTANHLIGTWNVTLEVDFSTCPTAKTGDIRQRQWLIGYENENVRIKVVGVDENEVSQYIGTMEIGASDLTLVGESLPQSGLRVWLKDEQLFGERYIGNNSCVIKFSLKGKRVPQ